MSSLQNSSVCYILPGIVLEQYLLLYKQCREELFGTYHADFCYGVTYEAYADKTVLCF